MMKVWTYRLHVYKECVQLVLQQFWKEKTSYIEEPDPDSLTEEDIKNNKVLLCVATPESDLLIDEIEE